MHHWKRGECPSPSCKAMFVVRAHTFILQARLAISLAWVAGYTNIIALIVCGYVVSHVTGHASVLGRDVTEGHWGSVSLVCGLLAAFFLGSLISGFATEWGRQRAWNSIYVLPAAIEIVLLIIFANFVRLHDPSTPESTRVLWWMTVTASVAMGLQNATITRISSGVVRTTHLTGVLTDLGHESAQLVVERTIIGKVLLTSDGEHRGPSFQRLALLASIFTAFILGSGLGTLAFEYFAHWSMLPPVLLLSYIILEDLRTPICAIENVMVAQVGGRTIPSDIAVFKAIHRGPDATTHDASAQVQLPDLTGWIQRVPNGKRAVILDITSSRKLGPMAPSTFHAMFAAAAARGQRVIIAGVSGVDCATINALTRADMLNELNCAATLDDALALVAVLTIPPSPPSH